MSSSLRVTLGPVDFLPRQGFVVVPLLPPFRLPDGTRARSALIGRASGRWVAYANTCRHLAIPLDLNDGEVMDDERTHLLCHHHGALFRPDDGLCVVGPCHGLALWPFSIEVDASGVATLVVA